MYYLFYIRLISSRYACFYVKYVYILLIVWDMCVFVYKMCIYCRLVWNMCVFSCIIVCIYGWLVRDTRVFVLKFWIRRSWFWICLLCDADLLYKDYQSDHKFTITTYSPTGVVSHVSYTFLQICLLLYCVWRCYGIVVRLACVIWLLLCWLSSSVLMNDCSFVRE